MRKLFSTLVLACIATFMFAGVTPPAGYVAPEHAVSALPVEPSNVTPGQVTLLEFADMSAKDFEKMTGKKLSLPKRIMLKFAQKKVRKMVESGKIANGKMSTDVFKARNKKEIMEAQARMKEQGTDNANGDDIDILALVSLICGILALISYYGFLAFAIAAIVCGFIAKKSGLEGRNLKFAKWGIILGFIAIALWILLFILILVVFTATVV